MCIIHFAWSILLVSTSSMGGWLPASSGTPFKVDVANFLDSGKKFSSSDPDDYVTELRARMSLWSVCIRHIVVHAELQEEVFKLSVDDWMYPRTEYLN